MYPVGEGLPFDDLFLRMSSIVLQRQQWRRQVTFFGLCGSHPAPKHRKVLDFTGLEYVLSPYRLHPRGPDFLLLQLVIIAAPILLVSIVVGLAISIIQATTSIQEQTLTFVPKILAMLGVLLLLGPWLGTSMVEFTRRLFDSIPGMAS